MLKLREFLEEFACQRIFSSEHTNGKNREGRAPYQVMRDRDTSSIERVHYSTIVQFFRGLF